jgi:hypothetical protein
MSMTYLYRLIGLVWTDRTKVVTNKQINRQNDTANQSVRDLNSRESNDDSFTITRGVR